MSLDFEIHPAGYPSRLAATLHSK